MHAAALPPRPPRDIIPAMNAPSLPSVDTAPFRTRRARLMERMHNFADAMPAVRTFSLLDADGRVLASSAADLVGRDLSGREYFQTANQIGQTDALLVGQPFFGMLGGWVLVLGRTVPGAEGAFGGLLVAGVDVEQFQALLQLCRLWLLPLCRYNNS